MGRRLANDSKKLVYAGLLAMALCSYGGCVNRHERVNAFNLVVSIRRPIQVKVFLKKSKAARTTSTPLCWLGSVVIGCRTSDRKIAGLTPGRYIAG